MRKMTKEWVERLDYHDLLVTLEANSNKKIPFIFMNGGTEFVEKEDLYSVKTKLSVSDKENEINFVMLPDAFDLDFDFLGDGDVINEESCKNDFLLQYLNNLRVVSYLPKKFLKFVKDKRMLALGYAEKNLKEKLIRYLKSERDKALKLSKQCYEDSVEVEKELTIHRQFKKRLFLRSVSALFDGANITKLTKVDDDISLILNEDENLVFKCAEIIEEEVDVGNSCVIDIELYKTENGFELHLLIMKRDENLISNYYYETLAFKDLTFAD